VLLTLVVHALATLGLLAAHAAFDRGRGLVDLTGLARRAPGWAAAVAVCLLGLAGAPPTGGFVARMALLQAGLEDSNLLIRVMLAGGLVSTAALAWACLRVLGLLWSDAAADDPAAPALSGRGWAKAALAVLATMLLATGLFGQVTIELTRSAAAGSGFSPGSTPRQARLAAPASE
jgi:NADH:ubiquinone oxidoreductase subunit 2 (subunit N)